MPRAVYFSMLFSVRMIRSDRKDDGPGGVLGKAKRTRRDGSRENEMCVKLYSERRVFDDRDWKEGST